MKRAELQKALALAKPSLGGAESVVPILSHFVFEKESLYAFNFVSAIFVPLETGLSCALHGETLCGLLDASEDEEVSFSMKKDVVEMRAGKSKNWTKLPHLPLSDAAFNLSEEEPWLSLPLSESLIQALQACALTMGEDSLKPEFAGVTVEGGKGGLTLYSTNNMMATRVTQKAMLRGKGGSAVLPHQSLALLFKLAAGLGIKEARLALGEKTCVVEFPGAMLISKLLPAKPELFAKIFEGHIAATPTADIPPSLKAEIAKAVVVKSGELLIEPHEKLARLFCSSPLASMESFVAPPANLKRALRVAPEYIAKALPNSTHWSVSGGGALVLSNPERPYHCIISTAQPRGQDDDDVPF